MKLMSLNTFGGFVYEPLVAFLKDQARSVDVFCLQEVFSTTSNKKTYKDCRVNLLDEIKKALPGFVCYYDPAQGGFVHFDQVDFPVDYGLATLVRKGIKVTHHSNEFVFGSFNSKISYAETTPRSVQSTTIQTDDGPVTIFNFHGLWLPNGKIDTPERFVQSEKIVSYMSNFASAKILCGDFNLRPDTQSLAMIERSMRNLIKEYGITSTRSSLYTKDMKYADYMIISPKVEVKKFEVLKDEISDHLPLLLEFNL